MDNLFNLECEYLGGFSDETDFPLLPGDRILVYRIICFCVSLGCGCKNFEILYSCVDAPELGILIGEGMNFDQYLRPLNGGNLMSLIGYARHNRDPEKDRIIQAFSDRYQI